MHLEHARQLALDLMQRHGLLEAGWRFAWGHGKRQLGAAQIRRQHDPRTGQITQVKTIRLSRHLVRLNGEAEVRETILHEIAHALAGVENGHNHVWKSVCRRIGARPERLAGEEVNVVPAPYAVICGCCDRLLARRHRRISRQRLTRTYCRHCGIGSRGRIRVRKMATERPRQEYAG